MVGVTGTNGKTSCSHWIAQALTRRRPALRRDRHARQRLARQARAARQHDARRRLAAGTAARFHAPAHAAVSMEVSSHGLAQDRVSGVEFDVALLTNLTRDHLDYHGTMRAYRNAKARLFRWPTLKWAVLNLDDAFGAALARTGARARCARARLRLQLASRAARAARQANGRCSSGRNLRMRPRGSQLRRSDAVGRSARSRARLIGRFNASNLLATLGVLLASGVPLDDAAGGARESEAGGGTHRALRRRHVGRSSSSITRIRRMRSRTCCARCASSWLPLTRALPDARGRARRDSHAAASSCASSAAAAIAIAASGRSWAASPRVSPTR